MFGIVDVLCFYRTTIEMLQYVYSPCPEENGARASNCTCAWLCTSDSSEMFGDARAIEDSHIPDTNLMKK